MKKKEGARLSKIKAQSYSKDLITSCLEGEIHSVFKRTFNILSTENNLYTVCQSDIFNGPRQIKLFDSDFMSLKVKVGMSVKKIEKGILINQQELTLEKAFLYDAIALVFPKKIPREIFETSQNIINDLTHQLDTVGYYRRSYENPVEEVMHQLLLTHSHNLMQGIQEGAFEMIDNSVKHLVGLGHGLTPSGDDFLTGTLLILNSENYPFPKVTQIVNQAVLTYQSNTNLISANELALGVEGKALEPILLFIQEIYDKQNEEQLHQLISLILEIGSSSGSDILAGVLLTLKETISKLNQLTEVAKE